MHVSVRDLGMMVLRDIHTDQMTIDGIAHLPTQSKVPFDINKL